MSASLQQYLQVAVPRRLYRVFTYAVPPDMPGPWAPGMRVRVPFGRGTLTGYIVGVTPLPETGGKATRIREIITRLEETPSVSPELLSLTEWMAERYLAPLGQCLRLAFPGAPDGPARRARAVPLEEGRPAPPASTLQSTPTPTALTTLRREMLNAITHHTHANVLLPGATDALVGLYLEATQAALDVGRSALVLIPQADQVETIHALFTARWGAHCQAYHAGLSPADRRQAWSRIQDRGVAVVIGTRSAAFAPLTRLGLVIVDQEDHPAYKAGNAPRYDARIIAAERAGRAGAVLALASAHPSLESAQATGPNWDALMAPSRSADLPPVTVVDLREVPPGDILSATMTDAIAACLASRKKVLLFLNRKGYAPVLLCRDCGRAVQCPTCSTGASGATAAFGLTFHKRDGVLRCTHCGHAGKAPDTCQACRGTRLVPFGFGTEALEESVRTRFPAARVARLESHRDRGGSVRERANAAILALMQARELDILIGTQRVVTRSPRPVASLIGLIYPDAALHLPDFRAAERAYHTLREVMTLVDRDTPDAGIVMQTYAPQHHVMRALAQYDPSIFYKSELSSRAALGYPPFGHLIGLRISGTREDLVASAAARWAAWLRTESASSSGTGIEVLGPIPASPPRLRNRFRWQLMVKGKDDVALRQAVRATLAELESGGRAGGLRYDIDVDPQSLL